MTTKSRKSQEKLPRVLLTGGHSAFAEMPGVQVIWPHHQESSVFDLSYGGLIVSSEGEFGRLKLSQSFDLKLKIRGLEDVVPLKAKLIQIHQFSFGFIFESLSTDNRLMIEQSIKDALVSESLREHSQESLPAEIRGDVWWHGPFDTNFILTYRPGTSQIETALVEYDNLIWHFHQGEISLQKSLATTEQSQSYYNSVQITSKSGLTPKVSMGASWMGRLIKCLEQSKVFRDHRDKGDEEKSQSLIALLQSQIRIKGVRKH